MSHRRTAILSAVAVTAGLLAAASPLLTSAARAADVNATCATLQSALDASNTGDVIRITEAACSNRSINLRPGRTITLIGAPTTFTGHAAGAERIVYGQNVGASTFRDLTLSGSITSGGLDNGAAMALTGSVAPTLDNVLVAFNRADNGGGVYIQNLGLALTQTITIRNSHFMGNVATDQGGGLIIESPDAVLIERSVFDGNHADAKGGLWALGTVTTEPDFTVRNSVFSGNEGRSATGGFRIDNYTPVLRDNLITGNITPGFGAGGVVQYGGRTGFIERNRFVFNRGGGSSVGLFVEPTGQHVPGGPDLVQSSNLFADNSILSPTQTTQVFGGGEYINGMTATITGDQWLRFLEPSAGFQMLGGGLVVGNAVVTIRNGVIAGNRTGGTAHGAALHAFGDGTVVHLLDSTVSGNAALSATAPAASRAPGVFLSMGARLAITNSIVAGNTGGVSDTVGGPVTAAFSDVCAGPGLTGGPLAGAGNICADPQLANAAQGTVFQTASSPTIDKGANALVPAGLATDFAGDPRISDGDGDATAVVDMGADEFILGPRPPTGSCPGRQWYLAEGTTRPGFDEFLLLLNTVTTPTVATVTYTVDGGPNVTRQHNVAGLSRLTIQVFDGVNLGRGKDHGTIVTSDQPLLVERSIYLNANVAGLAIDGDHNALAVASPQPVWYFAEGTSLPRFQTYFTVANPTTTGTVVTATFGIEGGSPRTRAHPLPALSRITIDANNPATGAGPGAVGFSTVLTATVPILAERPVYFNRSFPLVGANGTGDVSGATVAFGLAPSRSWYLAEGTVLPSFAMFLTLSNPGSAPEDAHITYNLEAGGPERRIVSVGAGTRRTVSVFDAADTGGIGRSVSDPVSRGVGVVVTTTASTGIVVERALYFAQSFDPALPPIDDGHATAGSPVFATTWFFAEGTGLATFRPFLTISNPMTATVSATIDYFPDDGSGTFSKTVTVAAGARKTVQTYSASDTGGYGQGKVGFSMRVTGSGPILVERPSYESHGFPEIGTVTGGNVSLGLPVTC